MAFIFWQPSDSSPPLFRPPLSELYSSGVETCLFRQNPSEAFHQKEKASEGFCFKGVSTPEKRRFEESGLASVTERPTGVKARKLRVLAQPLPSPAFHHFKGRVCFRDRASLRAMARKMRLRRTPSLFILQSFPRPFILTNLCVRLCGLEKKRKRPNSLDRGPHEKAHPFFGWASYKNHSSRASSLCLPFSVSVSSNIFSRQSKAFLLVADESLAYRWVISSSLCPASAPTT